MEVLAAIVLLSFALTVFLQLVWRAARDSATSQHRTQAALLAQERAGALLNDPALLQSVLADKDKADMRPFVNAEGAVLHPAFRWRAQAKGVPDAKGLVELAVVVTWERSAGAGPRGGSFKLVTLANVSGGARK